MVNKSEDIKPLEDASPEEYPSSDDFSDNVLDNLEVTSNDTNTQDSKLKTGGQRILHPDQKLYVKRVKVATDSKKPNMDPNETNDSGYSTHHEHSTSGAKSISGVKSVTFRYSCCGTDSDDPGD